MVYFYQTLGMSDHLFRPSSFYEVKTIVLDHLSSLAGPATRPPSGPPHSLVSIHLYLWYLKFVPGPQKQIACTMMKTDSYRITPYRITMRNIPVLDHG